MKNRVGHREWSLFVAAWLVLVCVVMAQTVRGGEEPSSRKTEHERAELQAPETAMDADLLEVTIPQLENFYTSHKYTVTQVVQWHLARIAKYNGIYRAVQTLDARGALATAAAEDADAAKMGSSLQRGPMWGVPILIKANTSVKGLVTTDGWQGYCIPGHELVAPKDATVVAKLRAAGAVILGQTNMPDFAASDTTRSSAYGRTGNAYDVRFSPGGSSGGTVTSITSNFAVVGTGTDTGNSIRMPSATSSVVGVFPTRGLVSIAGIAPLDWLLDNTGPIARNVTDAAIALGIMAGEDPLDSRTAGSSAKAQPGPYIQYLRADSLKGKRFGVPAFILNGTDTPFQGIPGLGADAAAGRIPLRPETRAVFMKAIEGLRAAGATVVFDDSILPDSYVKMVNEVKTLPYIREGTENFLKQYGPAEYHSVAEYQKVVGSPLPAVIIGGPAAAGDAATPAAALVQALIETDPQAEANVISPRRQAVDAYTATLDRMHLDGFVYPATQMPPPDETMQQDGTISGGPHSDTGWVNDLGVPAIVVPGGFYDDGLPFGLEISARPWRDGDLIGWAFAYEQATKHRKQPILVEKGLLPNAR
jgi:Asp-tRNA(Asn)/Glu-tRNA(Gln) amidotransferase A subunit family amidase